MSIKELLTKMLKLQNYYVSTLDLKMPEYSVAAGGAVTVTDYDVSASIPSNYDVIASIPLGSGNNRCYVYWCNTANNKITYQIKNATTTATTGAIWVRFILRKKSGGGYSRSPIFKAFSHLRKEVAV